MGMKTRDIIRIGSIANGRECPECGEYERGGHENNGERGDLRSYACTCCGTHWDAADWFAQLPEDAAAQVASSASLEIE
jgi:uncharacterized Zn finger protein